MEINNNTKLAIYKMVDLPSLLCGSESWTMLTKQESRIKGVKMRYLTKCMRTTRRHSRPLKMEPIGCLETSKRDYHYLLCINPEKHSSLLKKRQNYKQPNWRNIKSRASY